MNAAQRMQQAIQTFDALDALLKNVIVELLDLPTDKAVHRALELKRDIASTRAEWVSLMDEVRNL